MTLLDDIFDQTGLDTIYEELSSEKQNEESGQPSSSLPTHPESYTDRDTVPPE